MRSRVKPLLSAGAIALLAFAFSLPASARPQSASVPAGAAAPAPDQGIAFKDIDLQFALPAEYKQPADKDSTPGDAFEAYGPASKMGLKSHIELVLFQNLPPNAEMSKDIVAQIAGSMGEKVDDFKIVDQSKTGVAGKDAQTISATFRFKAPKSSAGHSAVQPLIRNKQVMFIHKAGGKDIGYMFAFTTVATDYPDQVGAFDHLIASIAYPSVLAAAAAAAANGTTHAK